jgi:hypothetical protein
MEAEARRIGRLGETYAYEYYKDKYKDVVWMNQHGEQSHPFDLIGFHKENNSRVFIEAKATILKGKKWFYISRKEYGWAMKKLSQYIVAHIYIDEKKGAEPQFTLTEFINPASKDSLLKLSMNYQ